MKIDFHVLCFTTEYLPISCCLADVISQVNSRSQRSCSQAGLRFFPRKTPLFLQYVQILAYMPCGAHVSLYLEHLLIAAGPSFANYFTREFCREATIQQRKTLLPLFWCGDKSPAKAGHPASQNLAELSINLIKNVLEKKPKDEITFLEDLEKRFALVTSGPTGEHGWLGESQELRLTPLPLDSISPDLLRGDGFKQIRIDVFQMFVLWRALASLFAMSVKSRNYLLQR
jgi:hypothetical protein